MRKRSEDKNAEEVSEASGREMRVQQAPQPHTKMSASGAERSEQDVHCFAKDDSGK